MFCLTYFLCSALPSKWHITFTISTTSPDTNINATPSSTSIGYRFGIHPSTVSQIFAMMQHGNTSHQFQLHSCSVQQEFCHFPRLLPMESVAFILLLGVVHLSRKKRALVYPCCARITSVQEWFVVSLDHR